MAQCLAWPRAQLSSMDPSACTLVLSASSSLYIRLISVCLCPLQYHRIFVRPGSLVDRLQALTKKVRPVLIASGAAWLDGGGPVLPACHALAFQSARRGTYAFLALQYGGFTLPLAYGRGILGLRVGPLPEWQPLTTVIGAPIALPAFKGGHHGAGWSGLGMLWRTRTSGQPMHYWFPLEMQL